MSGYQHCACRDCFEIAIGDGNPTLCHECKTAGCDVDGESECSCEHQIECDFCGDFAKGIASNGAMTCGEDECPPVKP